MTFKQRFAKWGKKHNYQLGQLITGWMRLAYGWGKRDERGRVCVWRLVGSFWYPGCTGLSQGSPSEGPHCSYCGGKIKEEKA